MATKVGFGKDVLSAARERIAWTFETFLHICVSFSGGKDSSVMLHLVMEEAIKRMFANEEFSEAWGAAK